MFNKKPEEGGRQGRGAAGQPRSVGGINRAGRVAGAVYQDRARGFARQASTARKDRRDGAHCQNRRPARSEEEETRGISTQDALAIKLAWSSIKRGLDINLKRL